MELWLVADTNLFFECKSLDQLPWAELGANTVVVLLTRPMLAEVDRHKKGIGRTRARALEIFGMVRAMLTAKEVERELRSSSPRVLVRLDHSRPDPDLRDALDYGENDEKLIGIVSTLVKAETGTIVELFTDDTNPASTASGLGLPFRLIDASWRRPPPESTEAKKIKDLEKDLATYRDQEPKIQIADCEGAAPENVIQVTRRISDALTETDIQELLASLRAKHPPKTNFATPQPSSAVVRPGGETVLTTYFPPPDEAVREYHDDHYPQWIAQCHGVLSTLHESLGEQEPTLVVRWPISNAGTRPASHVRVEFEARGPLRLVRLKEKEDADDEPDILLEEDNPQAPMKPKLPAPPRPPAFRMETTRTTPPAGAGILGREDAWPASFLEKIKAARAIDPMFQRPAILDMMEDLKRASAGLGPNYGASVTFAESALHRFARIPSLPPPHDPEGFYWDWPMDQPVTKGALTCERWRHQGGVELFTFAVEFDRDGEVRGAVECAVSAGNLTRPEQARLIVARVIERYSLRDIAEAMIKASP